GRGQPGGAGRAPVSAGGMMPGAIATACFLGVDGGGTKTRFLLVDAEARPLAQAELGTTYYPQVGLDGAREVLARGVDEVLGAAGRRGDDIAWAFFGLPAYGEDSAVAPQLDALPAGILGHARYRCGNDKIGRASCRQRAMFAQDAEALRSELS